MLAEHPIFVVFLAAVAAPLIAQTRLGSRLPVVVFEVVLGIVIGPHVLKLVADQGFLSFMREVGMVAVMFMAGMEIDFARIRGRPLTLGVAGWLASLAIGALALVLLQPILGLPRPAFAGGKGKVWQSSRCLTKRPRRMGELWSECAVVARIEPWPSRPARCPAGSWARTKVSPVTRAIP